MITFQYREKFIAIENINAYILFKPVMNKLSDCHYMVSYKFNEFIEYAEPIQESKVKGNNYINLGIFIMYLTLKKAKEKQNSPNSIILKVIIRKNTTVYLGYNEDIACHDIKIIFTKEDKILTKRLIKKSNLSLVGKENFDWGIKHKDYITNQESYMKLRKLEKK